MNRATSSSGLAANMSAGHPTSSMNATANALRRSRSLCIIVLVGTYGTRSNLKPISAASRAVRKSSNTPRSEGRWDSTAKCRQSLTRFLRPCSLSFAGRLEVRLPGAIMRALDKVVAPASRRAVRLGERAQQRPHLLFDLPVFQGGEQEGAEPALPASSACSRSFCLYGFGLERPFMVKSALAVGRERSTAAHAGNP